MVDPALLQVFVLHAVTVISPGPNFIVVAHAATSSSRLAALSTAAGVTAGAVLWATAATVGFAVIAALVSPLYATAKLVGAGYLIWHGVHLWRGPVGHDPWTSGQRAAGARRALRRGLLTNLANPTSVVFFASVLSVALPREAAPDLRIAAVVIVGLNALVWYGTVAMLLGHGALRAGYTAHRRLLDRVAGVLMIGLAAGVPLA